MSVITILMYWLLFVIGIDLIAKLHIRLQQTNADNIRMLNGMHEGLLVLNKPMLNEKECNLAAHSVAFCNKTA